MCDFMLRKKWHGSMKRCSRTSRGCIFFFPADDSFSPFRDQQSAWIVKFKGNSSFPELPLCSQRDRLVPGPWLQEFCFAVGLLPIPHFKKHLPLREALVLSLLLSQLPTSLGLMQPTSCRNQMENGHLIRTAAAVSHHQKTKSSYFKPRLSSFKELLRQN